MFKVGRTDSISIAHVYLEALETPAEQSKSVLLVKLLEPPGTERYHGGVRGRGFFIQRNFGKVDKSIFLFRNKAYIQVRCCIDSIHGTGIRILPECELVGCLWECFIIGVPDWIIG